MSYNYEEMKKDLDCFKIIAISSDIQMYKSKYDGKYRILVGLLVVTEVDSFEALKERMAYYIGDGYIVNNISKYAI